MDEEIKAEILKQLNARHSEAESALSSVPTWEIGAYHYGMATAFTAAIKIVEGRR